MTITTRRQMLRARPASDDQPAVQRQPVIVGAGVSREPRTALDVEHLSADDVRTVTAPGQWPPEAFDLHDDADELERLWAAHADALRRLRELPGELTRLRKALVLDFASDDRHKR